MPPKRQEVANNRDSSSSSDSSSDGEIIDDIPILQNFTCFELVEVNRSLFEFINQKLVCVLDSVEERGGGELVTMNANAINILERFRRVLPRIENADEKSLAKSCKKMLKAIISQFGPNSPIPGFGERLCAFLKKANVTALIGDTAMYLLKFHY